MAEKKVKYGDPARYPEFQDKQTEAVERRFKAGLDKVMSDVLKDINSRFK